MRIPLLLIGAQLLSQGYLSSILLSLRKNATVRSIQRVCARAGLGANEKKNPLAALID